MKISGIVYMHIIYKFNLIKTSIQDWNFMNDDLPVKVSHYS